MKSELEILSTELGQKLRQYDWSITCAESCTGGWVAKAITDIAGSSAYFDRGFVTYSNQAKQDLLGVKLETLRQYGAVSEAVAAEMAKGALDAASADIAISVSGIAGPGGGTADKPVGTVCFAVAYRSGLKKTFCHWFAGNRDEVRLQAAIFALKTINAEFLSALDTV